MNYLGETYLDTEFDRMYGEQYGYRETIGEEYDDRYFYVMTDFSDDRASWVDSIFTNRYDQKKRLCYLFDKVRFGVARSNEDGFNNGPYFREMTIRKIYPIYGCLASTA